MPGSSNATVTQTQRLYSGSHQTLVQPSPEQHTYLVFGRPNREETGQWETVQGTSHRLASEASSLPANAGIYTRSMVCRERQDNFVLRRSSVTGTHAFPERTGSYPSQPHCPSQHLSRDRGVDRECPTRDGRCSCAVPAVMCLGREKPTLDQLDRILRVPSLSRSFHFFGAGLNWRCRRQALQNVGFLC